MDYNSGHGDVNQMTTQNINDDIEIDQNNI